MPSSMRRVFTPRWKARRRGGRADEEEEDAGTEAATGVEGGVEGRVGAMDDRGARVPTRGGRPAMEEENDDTISYARTGVGGTRSSTAEDNGEAEDGARRRGRTRRGHRVDRRPSSYSRPARTSASDMVHQGGDRALPITTASSRARPSARPWSRRGRRQGLHRVSRAATSSTTTSRAFHGVFVPPWATARQHKTGPASRLIEPPPTNSPFGGHHPKYQQHRRRAAHRSPTEPGNREATTPRSPRRRARHVFHGPAWASQQEAATRRRGARSRCRARRAATS